MQREKVIKSGRSKIIKHIIKIVKNVNFKDPIIMPKIQQDHYEGSITRNLHFILKNCREVNRSFI